MSPYDDLPARAFWKDAVLRQDPALVRDLYLRKFALRPRDKIATLGNGFIGQLSGALTDHGYRVLDLEPAPPWLDRSTLSANGYGVASVRAGEIQTARHLLQLVREALGEGTPAEVVWTRKGRFHDALRPGVDPRGLDSADEVLALRADHLDRVREMLETMSVFVFSLGQTEIWADADGETVYPVAPGTIAGTWDEGRYRLITQTAEDVLADLRALRDLIATVNRGARMITMVSPLGPAATATDAHVLVATMAAKSALRTAMDVFSAGDPGVDYFPLYDLIAAPSARGAFLQIDLRSLSDAGLGAALDMFFDQHPPVPQDAPGDLDPDQEADLLEAFAR